MRARLTGALFDRLTRHVRTLEMNGESTPRHIISAFRQKFRLAQCSNLASHFYFCVTGYSPSQPPPRAW